MACSVQTCHMRESLIVHVFMVVFQLHVRTTVFLSPIWPFLLWWTCLMMSEEILNIGNTPPVSQKCSVIKILEGKLWRHDNFVRPRGITNLCPHRKAKDINGSKWGIRQQLEALLFTQNLNLASTKNIRSFKNLMISFPLDREMVLLLAARSLPPDTMYFRAQNSSNSLRCCSL